MASTQSTLRYRKVDFHELSRANGPEGYLRNLERVLDSNELVIAGIRTYDDLETMISPVPLQVVQRTPFLSRPVPRHLGHFLAFVTVNWNSLEFAEWSIHREKTKETENSMLLQNRDEVT
jgi:hypothetical protein